MSNAIIFRRRASFSSNFYKYKYYNIKLCIKKFLRVHNSLSIPRIEELISLIQ